MFRLEMGLKIKTDGHVSVLICTHLENSIIYKHVKIDRPTDRQTDRQTDR